jgi:sulfite reductase alpha subunit-like flavoprotein
MHTHCTGLGTGVAPLVGFLAHRRALAMKGTHIGPAHLFVGCRDVYSDFIYQDEIMDMLKGDQLLNGYVYVCIYVCMYVCMYV